MKCVSRAWGQLKRGFEVLALGEMCFAGMRAVEKAFFFDLFSLRLFYHTTLVTQWVPVADVLFYIPTTFANSFSLCSVSVS